MSDRRYKRGLVFAWLVAVIPPVLLLISVGVYLFSLKSAILKSLPAMVAAAAGQSLNREIRIGGVGASPTFDHVTFYKVAVSDAPTFAAGNGREAVSAARVDIDLDAARLVHDPKNAASFIKTVTLTRPYAYIERLPGNSFNFSSLFPKSKPSSARPFSGRIVAKNGTVVFEDKMAPAVLQPARNILTGLDGNMDFGTENLITYSASATQMKGRSGSIRTFGNIASMPTSHPGVSKLSSYDIHLVAKQADASYFTHYFLNNLTNTLGEVKAGRADVDIELGQRRPGPGVPLDIVGTANVTGGSFALHDRQILRNPVTNIAGVFGFTGNSVSAAATGVVDGMPVRVDGAVPSFAHATLAFRFSVPSVDANRLHDTLPFIPQIPTWLNISPRASVVATASGPIAKTRFDVAFRAPSASIYGTMLSNISGGVRYEGNTLSIPTVVASTSGQQNNIQLSGTVPIKGGSGLQLRATATNFNLAELDLPVGIRQKLGDFKGVVDAEAQYVGSDPSDLNGRFPLSLTARLRNASIHGVPIDEAAIEVSTDGHSASIARFDALQPNGALASVAGSLPLEQASNQPYALKVNIAGADLATLGSELHTPGLQGLTYFRGSVSGAAAHPVLDGRANIFTAGYRGYAIDQASADLEVTPNQIIVKSGSLRRLGVKVALAGKLSNLNSKSPQIDATVTTKKADISSIVEAVTQTVSAVTKQRPSANLESIEATGTMDATVHLAGGISQPSIQAVADIESGSVGDIDISRLSANASLHGNSIRLSKLSGTVEGASVSASGSINQKTKSIQGTATVTALGLDRVARLAGVTEPVTGSVSLTANAGGTIAKPIVVVDGSVEAAQYKDIQLNIQKLELEYANGLVTTLPKTPIVATSGPGVYTINSAQYSLEQRHLALNASVTGERIARLITLGESLSLSQNSLQLAKIPTNLDGALSIPTLTVDGPLTNPSIHALIDVGALTFGQQASGEALDITSDISYANKTYTVASLEGRGPTEYISGSGTLNIDGAFTGSLEASNIPLSLLRPFLPAAAQPGGEISDVTLIASGTAAKPRIVGSLSMSNVTVSGVTLDRIDSGKVTVADNRIDIAGISFIKSEAVPGGNSIQHVATISGSLPFVFSLDKGVTASFPADQPVSLSAQLPEQSISLITLFAPSIKSYALGGTIAANLNLGGTLRSKNITGSIAVHDGTLKPVGFKTALTFTASANFDGQRGTITSTRVTSSAGGYLSLDGTVDVAPDTTSVKYATAADALLGSLELNLNIKSVGFTLNEPKIAALYQAGFRGTVDGGLTVTRGLLAPLIAGFARVTNAVGILPSVPSGNSSEAAAPAFNPSFDIGIVIAPGTQVQAPEITAKTDGTFHIAGNLYEPSIVGDLNLRSGRFSLPTAIFRIVPTGIVHFVYNPPQEATERVDITATTSLSISPQVLSANPGGLTGSEPYSYRPASFANLNGPSQRYTITVSISGDLSSANGLILNFQSDPVGLSQAQILAALGGQQALNSLLVGGNVQQALQMEVQQIFYSAAIPTILAPFENNIAQAFGLEDFSVDYSPDSPLLVSVSKTIAPHLDIRYTRYVDSRSGGAVASTLTPLEYQVAVDYNFTNRFRLDVSTDDQHNTTFGIDGIANF